MERALRYEMKTDALVPRQAMTSLDRIASDGTCNGQLGLSFAAETDSTLA